MSLLLGLSFRNPFDDVLGNGDLRSMFCLIVFAIVVLVLAYLTNPSENSFRAYLTEQSFRHHLSRLDDNADDNPSSNQLPSQSSNATNFSSTTAAAAAAPQLFASPNNPPFHFANRASISLRTPKHVFHSFAIFTIAAMVPLSKASDGESRDGWIISDSWYIGAFGKWWRGGVFEEWYQDVIARSKDKESWSSGILNMKRLDMLQDYHAPTFSAKNLLLRGSPPKLRNRERTSSRNASIYPRSSTPPPLPKSASLPMHTVRKLSSNATRPSSQVQQQPHAQPCMSSDGAHRVSSGPSRSSSTLFEHSPLIAEVLRQITASKTSAIDLRAQLSDCQTAASQSHAVLQHEVDSHRDRKRQEDASKVELKARTKNLEDSKRGAEGLKKEADKKLKAIQSVRDGAAQRIDFLGKETLAYQKGLSDDRDFIANHRKNQVCDVERELLEALEQKRLEIKATEDVVHVLNHKTRELEDKLATEKDRLKILREKSDVHRQNRVLDPCQQYYPHPQEMWIADAQSDSHSPIAPSLAHGNRWEADALHQQGSVIYDPQMMQDDRVFPDDTMGLPPASSAFNGSLPFADSSHTLSRNGHSNGVHAMQESPSTARPYFTDDFVPTGLAAHANDESSLSRSFQSDSDPFINKDWRNTQQYANQYADESRLTSPISLYGPSANDEVHFSSSRDYGYDRLQSPIRLQRSMWMKDADFQEPERLHPYAPAVEKAPSSTWFSRSGKGLNPDAKEFNLFRPRNLFNNSNTGRNSLPTNTTTSPFDNLNPNGLGPASSSSTSQSLLRAFAPSPAEREALQRALGGSTNASFERLPSLSDVGSIPASPTNTHAARSHLPPPSPGRDLGSILPAWLQALPRTRKANFSPWEDEEPQESHKEVNLRRG